MSHEALFERLAALLRPFAAHHSVKSDTPVNFYLEEHRSSPKPQMFAAVQAKASYVSFHLFPIYVRPDLLAGLSPRLKARMQGKSCFNFKSLDQLPEEELRALIQTAHDSLPDASGPAHSPRAIRETP